MAVVLALAAHAEGGAAATLTVVVEGVDQAKGQLLVGVFTSRAGWPKAEGAAAVVRAPAQAPRTEVRVEGLPPGPVAASNGAKGLVGTPSFDDARSSLPPGGGTARVSLR